MITTAAQQIHSPLQSPLASPISMPRHKLRSALFSKKNASTHYQSIKPKIQAKQIDNLGDKNIMARIIGGINTERMSQLEDGRVTKAYFHKLTLFEMACLVISIIVIGLSVIQNELEFSESGKDDGLVILYIIFIVSIILAFMTIQRYLLSLEFQRRRNIISEKENLFTTGTWKYLLFELILVFVIPYPWLQGKRIYSTSLYDQKEIYYHVNEVLQYFSVLRVPVVSRALLLSTMWNNNRAQRICEMYAVQPGALFTMKSIMIINPLTIIFGLYMASIPYFAYVLRIAERPLERVVEDNFVFDYPNAMWTIIITMATGFILLNLKIR